MRLERQIAELQALETDSGKPLGARERTQLEDAQRDLARVKKARETVGRPPAAATREGGRGGRGGGQRGRGRGDDGLGKRRRESTRARESEESGEETDESVRRIPMPRDTPPPIPRPARQRPFPTINNDSDKSSLTNANREPLGRPTRVLTYDPHSPSPASNNHKPAEPKTIYESKPVVRDLRKEAVEKFVPVAVQRKLDARRGEGGRLLEEDEMSRLEKEGYGVVGGGGGRRMKDEVEEKGEGNISTENSGTADEYNKSGQVEREERRRREEMSRLREEEERFERELALEDGGKLDRAVTMEEVQDEC